MKLMLIIALSLVSSVAMADGFRCQSKDFRVKLYNHVSPEDGTRNPAILVVSQRGVGTVATLEGAEIEKTIDRDSVSYEGKSNGKVDGRFVYVKLDVEKQAQTDGKLAGLHLARLTVNANEESRVANVVCQRYLKGSRD